MEQTSKNLFSNINEMLDKTFSPQGKKMFLAILFLMLIAGVVFCMSFVNKSKTPKVAEVDIVNIETPNVDNDNSNNEVDINIDAVEDKMISIPVEDLGRANPFLPEGEDAVVTRQTSMYGYSLMAPPDKLSEGSDASRVVSTKVSGILYDSVSPSAILNIEGSDYLVRTGDYIRNYKVLSISKDLVTVQLGNNIYKAGVGQIMSDATVNYNTVYDLQHRFGGAKK